MRFFRKIVGERLYLSPFNPENFQDKWVEWMNDRDIVGGFGGLSNHVSPASARKTLEEMQGHRFAIVLLDGDVLIGQISLHDIDHLHRRGYFGILIGEAEHHNKGYGAEAVRLIIDYGFKQLNLNNIMLSVRADNYGGIACYKKVGFKEAGRRREWYFKDGKYVDEIFMDMLAREFEEKYGND